LSIEVQHRCCTLDQATAHIIIITELSTSNEPKTIGPMQHMPADSKHGYKKYDSSR